MGKTERYKSINELVYDKDKQKRRESENKDGVDIGVHSSLYIHAKGKLNWNDYIFQIPGIFDILGIKRSFKLVKQKEFKIEDILEGDLEEIPVYTVLQNPILFLTLVSIKLDEEVFCDKKVRIILKKAITAYHEIKDNIEFNNIEQEIGYQYLFEENQEQKAFAAWLHNEEIEEIEEIKKEIFSIVKDYWNEMSKEENIKVINCTGKESEGISFPKYMRSIFVVVCENYDCLPLVCTDKKSLWTTIKRFYIPSNIEDMTGEIFSKILLYMQYWSNTKTFYNNFFDTRIIKSYEKK